MKKIKEKELILEQLKKMPILENACQKVGISRMTFWRWRRDDAEFAKKADEALLEGVALMNDLAENQLITGIKDMNMTAILHWLRHRHSAYSTKIEINGYITNKTSVSTPEDEALLKDALRRALPQDKNNERK